MIQPCKTCAYFLHHSHGMGQCLRHAPSPVIEGHLASQAGNGALKARWPVVLEDEGCGEGEVRGASDAAPGQRIDEDSSRLGLPMATEAGPSSDPTESE